MNQKSFSKIPKAKITPTLVVIFVLVLVALIYVAASGWKRLRGASDDPRYLSPSSNSASQSASQSICGTELAAQFAAHQLTQLQFGDTANNAPISSPITVEVVNTPASITQGLSGRDEIGATGMLFIFNHAQKPSFWMREMKFDLDLIWISHNQVVEITPDVPAPQPNTPLTALPLYQPQQEVELVLEVPAGKAAEMGVQPGDQVKFLDLSQEIEWEEC